MDAEVKKFSLALGEARAPVQFWSEDGVVLEHKRVHETSTQISGGEGSGSMFGGWGSITVAPVTSTTTSTDRDYLFLKFGDREVQWTLSNLEQIPRAGHRVRCFFALCPDGKTARAVYMWNLDLRSGVWLTQQLDFIKSGLGARLMGPVFHSGGAGIPAMGCLGIVVGGVVGAVAQSMAAFVIFTFGLPLAWTASLWPVARRVRRLRASMQDEFQRRVA